MLARILIALAYLLTILNLQFVFQIERVSPIERSLFLGAALAFLLTRPLSRFIMGCWVATIGMAIILGALTRYPQFEWETLFLALNQITVLYVLLAIKPTRADRDGLLLIGALIPLASVALGLVYQLLGLWTMFQAEFATGLPRMSGSMIPAYLSAYAMAGTFAATALGTIRNRPVFFVLAIVDLGILLLAGGRAALAVTLPICAITFLASANTPLRVKVAVALAGPVALAGFLVTVGQTALSRLVSSTENGREILWQFTWGLADKHPWTGIGFGHAYWATPLRIKTMTGTQATHNDYIRLAAELGYIGMPLFYLLLILAVARAWLAGHRTVLPWIALAGFLFVSRSDNALATPGEMMLVVFGVLANARVTDGGTSESKRLWRRFGAGRPRRAAVLAER